MTTRGGYRLEAKTLPELIQQLNRLLQLGQNGAIPLTGLRLDAADTAAPTAAPAAGDPTIRAATIAGTITYYHWTGAAWTTF